MNTVFRFHPHAAQAAVALLLAGGLAPALAQTQGTATLKPEVLVRFTGDSGSRQGSGPFSPPVLAADGKVYGVTQAGGNTFVTLYGNKDGVAYGFDPADAAGTYRATPLGQDIMASYSNLLRSPANGKLYGGTVLSWKGLSANTAFGGRGIFTLSDGVPALLSQPTVTAVSPRGQLSVDGAGNVYMGSGSASACSASATGNKLWRVNPEGVYTLAIDLCAGGDGGGFYTGATQATQVQHKGGWIVSQVWSEADQALYALTAVVSRGVADSGATADYYGRSVGTLIKIGKATIDKGVGNNGVVPADEIEVLHTFLRGRDGMIRSGERDASSLVEDGEWLYGTTYFSDASTAVSATMASSGGKIWRVRKTDPSSFQIVHHFWKTGVTDVGTANQDGAYPSGPLVRAEDGNIYGTTHRDGRAIHTSNGAVTAVTGAGTLFRIKVGQAADRTDDALEILHRFDPAVDGATPGGLSVGGVVNGAQTLYGVAYAGGAEGDTINDWGAVTGNGTVFAVRVPVPSVVFSADLTASAASATVGASVALDWTAGNAVACTASGDWTGARDATGAAVAVGVAKEGANVFTLTCEDRFGGTATSSVTVTGEAAPAPAPTPAGSGGGGPLGALLLLPLASLALRGRRGRSVAPGLAGGHDAPRGVYSM